jgi:hypothetical protein
MDYKKGFKVKPKEIRKNGIVIFTDGTNDVMTNEMTCLAYGYKYEDGVCRAFIPSKITEKKQSSESTNKIGGTNTIKQSTNSQTIGKNNTIERSANSLVVGESNEIESDANNAVVFGKMGKATHTGEFCIGGGGFNSEVGLLQYSIIQLSSKTTGAVATTLYVDSDDTLDEQITLPANSVTTYEIFFSALCTGGTSGTAGNYEAFVFQGVIRTTNDGTMTHDAAIDRSLGSTGSLGTEVIDTSTAYTLSIIVGGLANVNTQYHAVAKLHINKTNAVEI